MLVWRAFRGNFRQKSYHDTSHARHGAYLHAGVVHNHLIMHDFWVAIGNFSDTLNEEAIRSFHDVCLVYGCYSFAFVVFGIFECILRNTYGCFPGDHLHD
jgi:hypothetical protein